MPPSTVCINASLGIVYSGTSVIRAIWNKDTSINRDTFQSPDVIHYNTNQPLKQLRTPLYYGHFVKVPMVSLVERFHCIIHMHCKCTVCTRKWWVLRAIFICIARPVSIIERFEAETLNYVSAASRPSPTLVVSQDARLAENVGAAADTTGTSTVAPDSHGGCSRWAMRMWIDIKERPGSYSKTQHIDSLSAGSIVSL